MGTNIERAQRIVQRLKNAGSFGDPKSLIMDFERAYNNSTRANYQEDFKVLRGITVEQERLALLTEGPDKEFMKRWRRTRSEYLYGINRMPVAMNGAGYVLFSSILQELALPPAVRKKVEASLQFYSKKPRKKNPKNYEELFDLYSKMEVMFAGHLDVAKEAIRVGVAHSEDESVATVVQAGPFKLVNTGGFEEKTMATVAKIVSEAARLIQAAGFSKVLYGNVQVTNTVSKANVLAFYQNATDEIFVRANVKATNEVLSTVIHELGHRLHLKFLRGHDRQITTMYHTLNNADQKAKSQTADPKPGDIVTDSKGHTYEAVSIGWSRSQRVVNLKKPGDTAAGWAIKLEAWHNLKAKETGVNLSKFVSPYAKSGGPGENFAEMFAYFCMGKLPEDQVELFKSVL